jgi:hypothetical protein
MIAKVVTLSDRLQDIELFQAVIQNIRIDSAYRA